MLEQSLIAKDLRLPSFKDWRLGSMPRDGPVGTRRKADEEPSETCRTRQRSRQRLFANSPNRIGSSC